MNRLAPAVSVPVALFAAACWTNAFGQEQSQPGKAGPEFDVASVKPAAPQGQGRPRGCPGFLQGRFSCSNATLKPLLLVAFNPVPASVALPANRFGGGPSWLESDRYDIEAKAPAGSSDEQMKLMLQNLLVERFGLVVHWEAREMPIYELVVAKGGLKMKTPAPAEGAPLDAAGGGGAASSRMTTNKDGLPELPPGAPGMFATSIGGDSWLTARMKSIADLLLMLSLQIGRPVVDKTGLTGVYDFNLRWSRLSAEAGPAGSGDPLQGGAPAPTGSGLDLFGAFEKQLGLKLEPAKDPIQVLVVDKGNRIPAEN